MKREREREREREKKTRGLYLGFHEKEGACGLGFCKFLGRFVDTLLSSGV